ncbi:hypothetical protein BT93_H2168 [Corymbia citriodora subsp. variegata]|nr:hypothetical protein BT93_H2168 [Corymbia citriodora subsp. variegata]KAF8016880.1 hypothetical protein BT93_H2168 [Corymbia citriodora subsp. variegata]KAF8016881.1 hypothetical protein BT93_H2168 [Corymbia citriodora subsp. variegata]
MYKNQLQELAQRSCFNLPSYACIREGPDHAPRFKACVNFNGEIFESPSYCNTLRQAEHAAAEVALNVLSTRGPSRSLTARVLDETGIYKNLLQETAHRAGLNLPVYSTARSGPGHVPTFTCTVGIAGMSFTGESAKTKKQAEKNAAIAAWSALKTVPDLSSLRPRDEAKQGIRRRDQNQPRRGLIRANAGNHSASPSTSPQLHRLVEELLMNYIPQAQGGSSPFSSSSLSSSSQKQKNFLSLLPPPPPRSASKILPPPRDIRWDREQDCGKRPLGSSIYPSPKIVNKRSDHPNLARPNSSLSFLGGTTSRDGHHAHTRNGSGLLPRSVYTGGFRPHRIAPAVQIRSVVPVCAAPPPVPLMRTQLPNPADDPLCPHTGPEVPPTSSNPKLEKLESDSAQLGSELNKKLQLERKSI